MGSLGGHDLDVLQCAVRCGAVSVAAGNAGAVTHHDRRGGQLRQTLVHAVHRRLVWKNTDTLQVQMKQESICKYGKQKTKSSQCQIKGLEVKYRCSTEPGQVGSRTNLTL